MFSCPTCEEALLRTRNELGTYWVCEKCKGRAVSLAVLRKAVEPFFISELWERVRKGIGDRRRSCPSCGKLMIQVPAEALEGSVLLDVCAACQLVWFDERELEGAPPRPPEEDEEDERTLSPAARQALAIQKVKSIEERARLDELEPKFDLETLLGWFGFPIEKDAPEVRRTPWLTLGIAGAIIAATLVALGDLETAVQRFGFVPARPWRLFGLTWITAFFLHGGLAHLIGNVYFLLLFGDNVEDHLGKLRFAALIASATLLGFAAHLLLDPRAEHFLIGASAGISGVLAFYTLSFPRARLYVLFGCGLVFIRWIPLPAWLFFALWVLFQLSDTWLQVAGFGTVSAVAHLGGALAGVLFWLARRGR